MRISDWSSDVCSSDLGQRAVVLGCLVHQVDRGIDLLEAGGLLLARRGDLGDDAGDLADRGDDILEAVAGLRDARSEEHTSELQSLMRISYAVFCLKKKKHDITQYHLLYKSSYMVRDE